MSLGMGGYARLELEDSELAIYSYDTFNWNIPEVKNREAVFDGFITIHKSCLVTAEIQEKIKRMPSKRKKLIRKKVLRDIDYSQLLDQGLIEIELGSNQWWRKSTWSSEAMMFRLVWYIFEYYQMNEKLPADMSFLI